MKEMGGEARGGGGEDSLFMGLEGRISPIVMHLPVCAIFFVGSSY